MRELLPLFVLFALGSEAIWTSPLEPLWRAMSPSHDTAWSDAPARGLKNVLSVQWSMTPDQVLPAMMHEGTSLRRDVIPFVGKVFFQSDEGEPKQFTCVLAGRARNACVTTAHSFLGSGALPMSRDEAGVATAHLAVTVEFEGCEQAYTAESIDFGTTSIDPFTETNREKDIAVIALADAACDSINPAVLLPKLDRDTAEEWLLPGAHIRIPVTIAAYYLGCTLGFEQSGSQDTCEQYSSTGYIDTIDFLAGEPIYGTTSIGTLPGSSGAPGLVIDTGLDPRSRSDDTYYWICLNVGHRPDGENACIALENGSFARNFIEARIDF